MQLTTKIDLKNNTIKFKINKSYFEYALDIYNDDKIKIYNYEPYKEIYTNSIERFTFSFGKYIFFYNNDCKIEINFQENEITFKLEEIKLSDLIIYPVL